MKMYKVCAKCGHVGRNHYVDKIFAVRANNGREAADRVRQMPRVKHHHKDAIRSVDEIAEEEYRLIIEENKADPYFSCRNIQEQRDRCVMDIMPEQCEKEKAIEDMPRKKRYYKKELVRNPKKFFNNYITFEEFIS